MSRSRVAIVLLATLAISGCAAADDTADDLEQQLTVFGAASLSASFETIVDAFEAEHEGVEVQTQFAGSSTLVTQLIEGAPADVLATADTASMDAAVEAGLANDTTVFATNTLTLVTPADNPAGVTDFTELDTGARLVICASQVPCGRATAELAERNGVTLSPISEMTSVAEVLATVTSGEADAGVVYRTDALGAGDDVRSLPIDGADSAVNDYPIAQLEGASSAELAARFIEFVLSEQGAATLVVYGFGTP